MSFPHLDLADDEAADEAFGGYATAYHANWTCFPDAVPALRRVRAEGLTAAVLTNGDHTQQRLKLERVGLEGHRLACRGEESGIKNAPFKALIENSLPPYALFVKRLQR